MLRKREKKVESLYSRLLPSAQHIYVHLYSVHCKVYMYIIDIEHQDFLRALEASRCTLIPTLGLMSEYPTCSVCVCVCVYTHTHHTYTSTPCKKWGDTSIAQTNPSHWKQTPTVDQLEKSRSPLFYIRMQWCLKHLRIAPKTPVEHTYAKRR